MHLKLLKVKKVLCSNCKKDLQIDDFTFGVVKCPYCGYLNEVEVE